MSEYRDDRQDRLPAPRGAEPLERSRWQPDDMPNEALDTADQVSYPLARRMAPSTPTSSSWPLDPDMDSARSPH
jgi:hypothetical protein